MLGWFFSGHPIVDVPNGLSPLLRRPHRVRRPWGFGYPPLGLAHVHLVPVSPSAVACPSSTRGAVGRTSRGPGGLALTCGGWLTALAGSGCLSTLLGGCGRSALAGGGRPSGLAQSGFLSAPTGGGLTPALLLARGSRGWSLGWRRVRRERLTTRTGIGGPGGWSPCKVWGLVGQTLLDYSPVVIAPYANPSGELAKA